MVLYRILASISAFCALAGAVSAQGYETDILQDIQRSGNVYHSYEFVPVTDTPAPKGYKPFYISHYGRHGSRHHIGRNGTVTFEYMEAARAAGILTETGETLMEDVRRIHDEHDGMDGELSARGGKEHATLARRMESRFPAVFKNRNRRTVHCQASIIPRCLVSMANFTGSLLKEHPGLEIDYITGQKYIEMLSHSYYKREEYRDRQNALNDSILRVHVDPSRIMKTLFKESPATAEAIDDPYRFVRSLFMYAVICQDLQDELDGLDLLHYFTEEEILGLYVYYNDRIYSSYGNSFEFGDRSTWSAKWCLEDIVLRADKALEGGSDVAADLRFGHDSGLLPLACLMGLEGIADRYSVAEAHLYYPTWKNIPMASNLQVIFYRNRRGNVLVKVLYNERETAIPAVPAFEGPYYRWEDLRPWLVSRSADKSFQSLF